MLAHEARVPWTDAVLLAPPTYEGLSGQRGCCATRGWEVSGGRKRHRGASERATVCESDLWNDRGPRTLKAISGPSWTTATNMLTRPTPRKCGCPRVDFDHERRISILDRDPGEQRLELDRTPKSGRSELVIRANTLGQFTVICRPLSGCGTRRCRRIDRCCVSSRQRITPNLLATTVWLQWRQTYDEKRQWQTRATHPGQRPRAPRTETVSARRVRIVELLEGFETACQQRGKATSR